MNNKENLQYFEATSMKGLFNNMKDWQVKNEKRLLSTNIQQEGDMFSCIALTNPTEVVLCNYVDGEPLAITLVTDNIGKEKPVLAVVPYDIF